MHFIGRATVVASRNGCASGGRPELLARRPPLSLWRGWSVGCGLDDTRLGAGSTGRCLLSLRERALPVFIRVRNPRDAAPEAVDDRALWGAVNPGFTAAGVDKKQRRAAIRFVGDDDLKSTRAARLVKFLLNVAEALLRLADLVLGPAGLLFDRVELRTGGCQQQSQDDD